MMEAKQIYFDITSTNMNEMLVEDGIQIDINWANPFHVGKTFLHAATLNQQTTMVVWLLELGANPNTRDRVFCLFVCF